MEPGAKITEFDSCTLAISTFLAVMSAACVLGVATTAVRRPIALVVNCEVRTVGSFPKNLTYAPIWFANCISTVNVLQVNWFRVLDRLC